MNLKAAKTELPADIVEALPVAFGKLPFRTLFQAANGDDDNAHGAQTSMRANA